MMIKVYLMTKTNQPGEDYSSPFNRRKSIMKIYIDTIADLKKYKDEILKTSKPCTIFQIGGFRPKKAITQSYFGKVLVCKDGEDWPQSNGKPMIPLCQLNLEDAPYIPQSIKHIAFITIFIDDKDMPIGNLPNGDKWCLRAYEKNDKLIPIIQANYTSQIKPKALRPIPKVFQDFPPDPYSPLEIDYSIEHEYLDEYPNYEGIKLGGFPAAIQRSKIFMNSAETHHYSEFVLHIDTIEKANWMWGDLGVGYFGISKDQNGNDIWSHKWECY